MATFSKRILSGSTDGKNILVAATATAGTVIHTGSSVNTTLDEVWLYAFNSDTVARKLTIEWGGVSAPSDLVELTIQPEAGSVLVIPGWLIQGNSGSALVVRAFASSANVVTINGYVNRIE